MISARREFGPETESVVVGGGAKRKHLCPRQGRNNPFLLAPVKNANGCSWIGCWLLALEMLLADARAHMC